MSGVWHGDLMGAKKLGHLDKTSTLFNSPLLAPIGAMKGDGGDGSSPISISIGFFLFLVLGDGNRLWYIDSGGGPMWEV